MHWGLVMRNPYCSPGDARISITYLFIIINQIDSLVLSLSKDARDGGPGVVARARAALGAHPSTSSR
jgi:hypothetical protein